MTTTVERHYGGYIIGGDLVQSDWDFPGAAEGLGWSLRRVQKRGRGIVHLSRVVAGARNCLHTGTDGTVACPDCGIPASDFIRAAADYLDARS